METKIAQSISGLFNPLIVTTYYMLIMLNSPYNYSLSIPEKAKWMIIGLVFITTYLLPLILAGIFSSILKKTAKIETGDERNLVLSIAAVFYFLTYYLLGSVQLSPIFNLFILGIATLSIFVLIISNFWKISVYMTACGAITGAFTSISITLNTDLLMLILLSLVISGVVGYSRLKVSSHNPVQIYSGFGMGASIITIIFLYF